MVLGNIFAKIFSYLLHPLLMPTYGMLIFLNFDSQLYIFLPYRAKLTLVLMTFAFTCMLPAINVLLLLRTKFIKSVYMQDKEERNLSYITTLIFYLAEYYIINNTQVFTVIKLLVLGAAISVALALVINFRWKISAHMIAAGGLCGAFLAMNGNMDITFILPVAFILSGLVGFARLELNAHTPAQVYAGFLVGFLCEWGIFQTVYSYV